MIKFVKGVHDESFSLLFMNLNAVAVSYALCQNVHFERIGIITNWIRCRGYVFLSSVYDGVAVVVAYGLS